jgi:hypothetical protein
MKLQFSNEGFTLLQNKLDLLSMAALHAEAELIRHDVKYWFIQTFELDQTLITFLNSLAGMRKFRCSIDLSFAIENRIMLGLGHLGKLAPTTGQTHRSQAEHSKEQGTFYCGNCEKLIIALDPLNSPHGNHC